MDTVIFRRVIVAIVLVCFWASILCGEPLILGDLDESGVVSYGDLRLFAEDWLSSSEDSNFDGEGGVNFNDFSLFAANWQKAVPVLVINEFMASNDAAYADPQGDYDDWIEIYNTTDSAIDLAGMYISDDLGDLTKQQILAGFAAQTTVPAHGYLILWADEDLADGANHLAFKLSAGGEDIVLVASDGTTIIDSLSFGDQLTDISYGSYPNGSYKRRYFGLPTPGAANNEGYLGIVPAPEFSRSSGIFTDTFQLTITVDSNTAEIYYTTDHSIPTTSSTLYTGPITVSSSVEIIARAFEPGYADSEVEGKNFIKVDQEVAEFSSDIPVVVLDSFGYNIDAENGSTVYYPYRNVYVVVVDTNDAGRATVIDDPDCKTRGGMRVRGQTSAGFSKRQYKFESWNYLGEDKDVSFLGMPEDSDWIIHGPYVDKSLVRNHLTYKLARDMGNYAVRTRLCEVFNNQDDGVVTYDDYHGVYVLMERIKICDGRLEGDKLEPTDNAEPEITGSYIIKQDKWDTPEDHEDEYFSTNYYFKHFLYDTPDYDEITAAQKTWIKSYCDQAETALRSSYFADPVNGYQKYIDPDSMIDYFIMAEISRNVDGYILSDYWFKPRNGRIQRGPVWDYNYAWGNADYRNAWEIEGWQHLENSDPNNTSSWGRGSIAWMRRMFEDDNFYIRCIDRWYSLRENLLKSEDLLGRIQGYADELAEAQERNFVRWPVLGVDLGANWFIGATYEEEIEFLKEWTHDRMLWMDTQFRKPPRFNQDGGEVDSSFELTMVPGSEPYAYNFIDYNDSWKYLDGGITPTDSWPSLAYGSASTWPTGDGPFGFGDGDENTLIDYGSDPDNKPITTYFRKFFNVDDPNMVASLTLKIQRDAGAVVWLNGDEYLLENMSVRHRETTPALSEVEGADESTYFERSIDPSLLLEDENLLAVEVHLSSIDDDDMSFDVQLQGVIGHSTTPGTLYYTTDGSDPRLDGGAINPSACIYFAPISFTKSTQVKARELDNGEWTALNEATFSVGPIVDSLRITELMYHPADVNTEYIELKNIGTEAINLNLVHFTDGVDFTFGDYVLGAGEYVLVVEDTAAFTAKYGSGYPIAGEYEGSLDNGGEEIVLRDAAGTEIHDFDYKDSWYDITDGGGFSLAVADEYSADVNDWDTKDGWRPSSQIDGTPGAGEDSSIPVLGSIVINEVLAHSHMAAPDWVELYNTTANPINIGGWFLSDSEADDPNMKKYEIAAGTIIGAGGYVVFYEDQDFGNPSDPGCNIPFGLSEGGETVYLRSGNSGEVTGYIEQEDFGASDTGVAFGRYEKSGGTFNFVAMSYNTAGGANAYPKVGPVVINEIMYNPASDNADEEYVELHNITSSPVTLETYDDIYGVYVGWQLQNGIDYTFPLGTTIPAGGYLIVAKDPATFTATYGSMLAGVNVVGPYDGKLGNGGEKVDFMMPGDKEPGEDRYYIRVDRLNYSDGSHPEDFDGVTDPWPTSPDGGGDSLSRITPADYGNDVINWQGQSPTPGSIN